MGVPLTIRINGRVFTRNSVAIRLNGVIRITDVESIDWSDEKPQELVPGMNQGGPPLGKAAGNYGCAASISLYRDAAPAFEKAVLAADPLALAAQDLSAAKFQLVITMAEEARTSIATLVDCSITTRQNSVSKDGGALVKVMPLQPRLVIEDGLSLARLRPAI